MSVACPTSEALLCENRELRLELDAVQSQLAWFETSQSGRLALSERTILVSETELPNYVPFSLNEIRRMRRKGILPYIADPLGRKLRVLYNLKDVEATLLSGQPRKGPLVKTVDWDKVTVTY